MRAKTSEGQETDSGTPPPEPGSPDGPARDRKARKRRRWIFFAPGAALIAAAVVIGIVQPWVTPPGRHSTPLRYLGVHEPDAPGSYAGVNQFAQEIGTQPNLVSYYSPWDEPFQRDFAVSAQQHGTLTLVQIDPMNISLASIAAGKYDAYLRSFGAAVRTFNGRIVISIGHEMNGNWYSWGHEHTPASTFTAAWRHIVTVFRGAGADNVVWLWTVNIVDNDLPTPIPDPAPWWPGSSYVNWVGIDGYYYNSSATFSSLFGPTIVDVRRLTSDPILVAETGAATSAGQAAKINDLFDGIRTYGLLGFIWFDENAEGHVWRIASPQAFAMLHRDAQAFLRPFGSPAPTRLPASGASS